MKATPFAESKETGAVGYRLAFVDYSFIVAIREDLHVAVRAGQASQAAGLQMEIEYERAGPSGINSTNHANATLAVVVDTVLGDCIVGGIVPKYDSQAIVESDDIAKADHVVTGPLYGNAGEVVAQGGLTAGVSTYDVACDNILDIDNTA